MQPSFICLQPDELKKFIAGDMVPKRVDEIEDHLSTCEACRGSLEASVGDQDWWQDLGSALRSDNADCEYETTESRESVCQRLKALLGPTDDPSMLGRIGAYEIIGLLGYGGMGAVFKGFDRSLNRFVAIKMLLPHLAASGAARKRFAREGQAVAAVVDDHVMAIHCVDEWQGVPYLVMTYSRGVSLQKRLSDNGPLEVREILRIGMQAAKGLAAAHAQGIVHRDIKPANIFLDQSVERVQLMDFGLARAVDDASLTRSGTLAGTPQYMSPEQARAETVDHQSDLFSLGSVMYAMCTGHAPFRAESSYSVLRLITDKEPRPIREINPDVPEWLCAIITKLMAKQASERYSSAKEVSELLEDCLAHVQQPATMPLPEAVAALAPIMSLRPPIGKFIAAAAFAFALLFAGVFIVLELNKGTLTIQSDSDDVRVRITSGHEVVEELKVSKSGQSVRVAAGKYNVEIIGETDELTVENGQVMLLRAGTEVVRIVHGARNQTENQTSFAPNDGPGRTTSNSLLDKLQGRWHVVEHYYLGSNPKRRLCSAIVRGNRVEISPGYGPRPLKIDLSIGALGPPQQIDLKFANYELERQEMLENGGGINEPPSEPVLKGIIEVDGDLVSICMSNSSDSPHRPIAFISGEEQILWNFTRAVEPSATSISPSKSSPESSPKYFLTLKFYEKREDSVKQLANPTIEANAGTPFTYVLGGVINEIYSGLRLNGNIGSLDDSTVQASLKIGKGSEEFEVNSKLQISETKTIQLDEVTWLDLRLEPERTDNTLKLSANEIEVVSRSGPTEVKGTESVTIKMPAKGATQSYPVQEATIEQADLSTPQSTLEFIDLYHINNPTHVPLVCYTDDALLEMSGVMLQQLGYMSVLSQLYSHVDTQIRIQTSGVSDEKDSGPIIPGVLPSFHLQVDALLKEHTLAMPPEQCKKALELLLKSTVASLDGNESRVIPDRELYRLAAGVLKSTREFLPKAGELSKRFPDSSSEADPHRKEVVTATQYDIEINGDEAIATTLVDRNSSVTPMKFKLRRVDQRWLVSEIFSDEILTQINLSMPQMTGDMPANKTEGAKLSPDISAFETELAKPSNAGDSPIALDHSRVVSESPENWTDFLALLPETGAALVLLSDQPEIREQMSPIAKKVAKGASIQFIEIQQTSSRANGPQVNHTPSTHFLLMKDRQVVDTRYGVLTEEKLQEFVSEAKDWLSPHSTGVEENSLVRVDCYIFPGAGNIGTQSGDAFPITAAVIAVHEDQALLLGPDSVAEYMEKGYACVAVDRDADGKKKQLPLEVLLNGPVKLLGRNGEPHKRQASVRITHSDGTASELPITSILPDPDLLPTALEEYDVDSAIYRIRGFHGLKPVKLAAIEEAITVGAHVLSGSFSQKPLVPLVLGFSPPMQWQTQKVLSIDGVLGNMHGPETFDVLCPSLPVPSGFTFNEHGRLIGKYALGSPTHENMKHGVFKSHATRSIIHAVLDKIDDAGLKAALLRTLE